MPDMKAILEALLFAAPEPISVEEIQEAFGEDRSAEVEAELRSLIEDYGRQGRGLQIEQVAGGYRITTRPDLADVLREFVRRRNRSRLSRAALETLAVVAYRQPVTAAEVEDIRGVNPSSILKSLLEKRLVRISGRKKVVGNPFLYETTVEFLEHFGLNRIEDLPSLEEFSSLLDEAAPPTLPEGDGAQPSLPLPGGDDTQPPPAAGAGEGEAV